MTDIGTGSYTIIQQTAAETMGVPLERVVVKLGDSRFPVSAGSGGQFGAVSATSGVYAACMKLREAVAQKLGVDPSRATDFVDGIVVVGGKRVSLGQAAGPAGPRGRRQDRVRERSRDKYLHYTFGAHFVEVAVDSLTAETRVRRMLAVCSAGRILNPKAARSQIIGAMTMGVGAALMEDLVVDKRVGFFVNHDLASYEVPVHADIPHQEVIFLDGEDPTLSPMKARAWASSASAAPRPRSPTPSTTPRVCGCATIRSRSTNCCRGCRRARPPEVGSPFISALIRDAPSTRGGLRPQTWSRLRANEPCRSRPCVSPR